jgi:hypothetical protein
VANHITAAHLVICWPEMDDPSLLTHAQIAKEVGRNSFFAPDTNYAFARRVIEALIELDYLDCGPPKERFVPASREDHELGYN